MYKLQAARGQPLEVTCCVCNLALSMRTLQHCGLPCRLPSWHSRAASRCSLLYWIPSSRGEQDKAALAKFGSGKKLVSPALLHIPMTHAGTSLAGVTMPSAAKERKEPRGRKPAPKRRRAPEPEDVEEEIEIAQPDNDGPDAEEIDVTVVLPAAASRQKEKWAALARRQDTSHHPALDYLCTAFEGSCCPDFS